MTSCLLLAQSGHAGRGNECLRLGVKRTLAPEFAVIVALSPGTSFRSRR